jgi:hypothetical protein
MTACFWSQESGSGVLVLPKGGQSCSRRGFVQVFSRRFVQVGILIFMAIVIALPAQAVIFSNASLKGTYSFSTNLSTANASTNQFAMVGVLAFDGAGHVTGSFTSISFDTVQTGTLSGTYTVSSNGTGTITFTTGSTAHLAITLNSTVSGVAHGVQLLQINDSSNEILSGTAVLQSTTTLTYSVASVKGNFAFQYNPRTAAVSLAEDGGIGIFTFDGKGNLKGTATIMFDGGLFGGPFTGAVYTVNPDGSGTISGIGMHGLQIAFALNTVTTTGQAKGLQFLDTNTGDGPGNLVITGSALKQ